MHSLNNSFSIDMIYFPSFDISAIIPFDPDDVFEPENIEVLKSAACSLQIEII